MISIYNSWNHVVTFESLHFPILNFPCFILVQFPILLLVYLEIWSYVIPIQKMIYKYILRLLFFFSWGFIFLESSIFSLLVLFLFLVLLFLFLVLFFFLYSISPILIQHHITILIGVEDLTCQYMNVCIMLRCHLHKWTSKNTSELIKSKQQNR